MSFLNLRSVPAPRPNNRLITDLPDPLLKAILQNCTSVDMTRCSLVNKQFREVIEDMEDERTESLRSCQKAKIFICDRRRAILEGVSTMVPTRLPRTPKNSESSDSGSSSSSSIASTSSASSVSETDSSSKTKTKAQQTQPTMEQKDARKRNVSDRTKTDSTSTDSSGTNSKATNFISDQYTDIADPNWAFAFDFDPWLQDYEVNEVYLKNFCSFLEREKIDDTMSPSAFKGRTAFYESQQMLDRATSMSITEAQIVRLSKSDEAEMKSLSSGRIERLAKNLANLRSTHYIFKDSVCYGARPPVTIFYFLNMMRQNTRALTFDHVQAATKVELHDVLDMGNLHRLTVIQPNERQCLSVRSSLLVNWIKLPDATRKRISVHLVGCKEFRPKDVLLFVQEWLNYMKPVVFKQIAIDGGSYKYNEFVHILERLHDFIEKRPPRSPLNRSFVNDQNQHSIVFDKVCRIPHPKDRRFVIQLKYCKSARRMVLTIEKEVAPAQSVKTLSPVSTLTRLARPQSAAAMITTPIRKISSTLKPVSPIPTNNTRQLIRPLSHDPMQMGCRDNVGSNGSSRMFNRLVSFLGTSS